MARPYYENTCDAVIKTPHPDGTERPCMRGARTERTYEYYDTGALTLGLLRLCAQHAKMFDEGKPV